ncbi:DUF397 domain-containing protein [Allokutzneria albata]|uniref:DUF397 domain-containing protein n=1 Tax=Allokutzneria albata TaxID=211114 RepID=A0A1H0DW76_ALLAB|nr:DUF397 domain-containing protein [Allokutzneria albata]SDM14839.1 protein of unknown function [Allokutzneria albata]SDN74365.1 protein of unknown function [Allokutzneria albata]
MSHGFDEHQFTWRTSSYTDGGEEQTCVEVGEVQDNPAAPVGLRDSKNRSGGTLLFTRPKWHGFVDFVKRDGYLTEA